MRTPASAVAAAAAASVYSEGKIPPILSNQEKWKRKTKVKNAIIKFTISITTTTKTTKTSKLLKRFEKYQLTSTYLNFTIKNDYTIPSSLSHTKSYMSNKSNHNLFPAQSISGSKNGAKIVKQKGITFNATNDISYVIKIYENKILL